MAAPQKPLKGQKRARDEVDEPTTKKSTPFKPLKQCPPLSRRQGHKKARLDPDNDPNKKDSSPYEPPTQHKQYPPTPHSLRHYSFIKNYEEPNDWLEIEDTYIDTSIPVPDGSPYLQKRERKRPYDLYGPDD